MMNLFRYIKNFGVDSILFSFASVGDGPGAAPASTSRTGGRRRRGSATARLGRNYLVNVPLLGVSAGKNAPSTRIFEREVGHLLDSFCK